MSAFARLIVVAALINTLVVINAIVCLPPMVGSSIRDWRWAVAYVVGFTVIGVFSFVTQNAVHATARREQDAKRTAAMTSIAIAGSENK